MSEPFLGEIRMFTFGFVPKGWAACAGQLLPINQYQPLFAVLGTNYGGNGVTNFALPDLRGRAPAHVGGGGGSVVGERGGSESVTLTSAQAPCSVQSAHPPTTSRPGGAWPGQAGAYGQGATGSMPAVGGGQPHENRSPFLAMTYAIALVGIFPSQN